MKLFKINSAFFCPTFFIPDFISILLKLVTKNAIGTSF